MYYSVMYYSLIAYHKPTNEWEYLWGDSDEEAVQQERELDYDQESGYILFSIVQTPEESTMLVHDMIKRLNA